MTPRDLVAGSVLALALTGCASSVPPRDTFYPPVAAAASVEQLSGNYCYYGPDLSVRSFQRGTELIPFLDVDALWWPATIRVEATPVRIVFTCTDETGYEEQHVFLPSDYQAEWREDRLVLPWKRHASSAGASVGFGVLGGLLFNSWEFEGMRRESHLYRSADGQLVMTDFLRRKGYSQEGNGGGQFWEDEDAVALLLEPATGDCAPGMPSRPLQPRFERGLDLRVSACADRLAEQFASVLVEKGEPEDVAQRVSNETVDDLVTNGGNWTEFWLEAPSGVTYKFDVGKKDDGCVLRMFGRVKKTRTMTSPTENRIWFLAKRPLPECACVP